jgi:LCP family protein required for cell wall assembly
MRRIPQWFVLLWVVVLGVVSVTASFVTYHFVRDRAAELDRVVELPDAPQFSDLNPFSSDTQSNNTTPTPVADTTGGVSAAQPSGTAESGDQIAGWQDPRRVTILLLGIDQRAGETGTFPTDTIILLSMDPVGKTAAILSIPRDLWVTFPGIKQPGKINTANILGDQINYPGGGGPMLALKTVENLTGVPIDFYILINFEVFTKVVDTIGPVEVCPPEPIDDDKYPDGSYGYISIHFDAGCQELGSERLLQYARTRHGDSDIARSSRQQEVILAVRKKVLSTGGVMALLPEAPALWESVQANIRTNMAFDDIRSLALTAENIAPENIRQGQIGFGEVLSGTSPSGEEILIPISTDITLLIEDLFRPPNTPSSRTS